MAVPTTSINTRIVVDFETAVQGVVKTTTPSPKGRKIACSETIDKTKGLEQPDELRSDPNPQDFVPGDVNVAGDLTLAPSIITAPFFLQWFTNSYGAATGAGPYVRTGKMTGGVLKTICMEKGALDQTTPQYQLFRGLAAKSFSGDFKATGLLKWKFGVVGMEADAVTTTPYDATVDDWETGGKFHHAMIALSGVKIGGSDVAYILNGSWNCERTIVMEDRPVGGGGVLASLPGGRFNASGNLAFKYSDSTVTTLIQSGAASSLELIWTYSASPAYKLSMKWARVFFEYAGPKKVKDGLVDLATNWHASYDGTDLTSFSWGCDNATADAEYA